MNDHSSPRRHLLLSGVAALVLAALGALAWNLASDREDAAPERVVAARTPTSGKATGYVGSAACAECHAEIASTYLKTHSMSRSTTTLEDALVLEDYDRGTFATPDGRVYRVEKTGDDVFHHEIMFDRIGEPIYDQAVRIAHVLGSGRRGRAYIIERGGQLFQSPISWYAQSQSFGLSPGYQPGNHSRFDRKLHDECLFCHVGRTAIEDRGVNRFSQPPFHEGAIGCERCHGPGEAHVRFQKSGSAAKEDDIINPVRLDSWRRDSVCYQCHLRAEQVVLRQGQSQYDFRPGMKYEDVWIAYVEDATQGEVTGVVTQFHASACYRGSQGKLGCVTCHDPHSRPAPDEAPGYYRQRCLQCHESQDCAAPVERRESPPASGSCIYCHMPPTSTKGIPHTALTDHRILRDPGSHSQRGQQSSGGGVLFAENSSSTPAKELRRVEGLLLASRAAAANDVQLGEQALKTLGLTTKMDIAALYSMEDAGTLARMGIVLALTGRTPDAIETWEQALKLEPNHEASLRSLTVCCIAENDVNRGLIHAERLTKANPHVAEHHWLRVLLLDRAGRVQEAIDSAEQAVALDPTAVPSRRWLVEAYQRIGQTEKALEHQDVLQRMLESNPAAR
jgi:predicted CXXCH cytochrome family protein